MPTDATRKLTIASLLRPHRKALAFGLVAVIGEGIANLLEPWPLKIVLDNVLRDKRTGGWLNNFISHVTGNDKYGILEFAAVSVLVIALFDAMCTYAEKF